MSSFADRILQVREAFNETRQRFAVRIGKSENTVYNWETGKSAPTAANFRSIAATTGANEHWLRTGEGKPWDVVPVHSSRHEHRDENARAVPRFGGGLVEVDILVDEDDGTGVPSSFQIRLPRELVNNWRTGVQIRGDSMAPTLKDGDYAGIDPDDKTIISGELYLLRGLLVRRLEDESPLGIRVRTDNPSHGSILVDRDKIKQDIMGRIAWIFGTRKQHN